MSKIAFTKLNLVKNTSIQILEWENQKLEIKQYLPVKEKMELISRIVGFSMDDNVFINPCKIEIFKALQLILSYTNINLTDKQAEDTVKMYDLFVSSGFYGKVKELIPQSELDFINKGIIDTIHEIYSYKNSFAGMIEQTRNSYQDIDEQVTKIEDSLSNPETMGLLKDVVTKLS